MRYLPLSICLILLLLGPALARAQGFEVTRVADGLTFPVFLTAPPGDTSRAFILEQYSGAIRILELGSGQLRATPFLTLSGLSNGFEQGLLGLAFHPDYDHANNGYFYVYTATPESNVVRYQVSADPNLADEASASPVLSFSQPQNNHNGGWIGFGPDDLLYIATGDGGGAFDDDEGHTAGTGNSQDITDNWLGKILRVDVDADDFPADAARNYAVPDSNPFVGVAGDDEIWSYGLRNPYRASFDRSTGDLYIADVGQSTCEELNVEPASSAGGLNYGWRLREGTIETQGGGVGGAKPPGAIDPIFDYPQSNESCSVPSHPPAFVGEAIIGGYAYRGPIPALQGRYFFGDFDTGSLWSLVWDGSDPTLHDGTNFSSLTDHSTDPDYTPDVGSIAHISSFGEDAEGNLYVLDLYDGEVFRLPEAGIGTGLALGGLALLGLSWLRRARLLAE